ncbi:DNA polymerase III subunit delta [Candidatus Saccharibacteria bacterium]|nr:DNA polymerase III subunit delta [Candidatus Saccharibacteria bacterium]
MLQRRVDAVAAKFSEQHSIEAITRLDATEIEPQNLLAEIVNINMFAPQRLVIIKDASATKAIWQILGDNLARIPDGTELIITAIKPDKRTKTYKDLLKSAKTREFLNLKPGEMKSWLTNELRTMNLEVNTKTIDELINITSGDSDQQARLVSEITKLQVLGRPIDADLVRQIVEPNLATNAFEVLHLAITSDQRAVANELKHLRDSGEDANKFFGLLTSQIFTLAVAIFAGSHANVAKNLKIHPFQLTKMRDLADKLGDAVTQKKRIREISKIFMETDAKIKLSRPDETWVLIETALAKISVKNY